MITENDLSSFENYERKFVQLITEDTRYLSKEKRHEQKRINAEEVLKLNKLMSLKLYNKENALRLNTEYLNFIIRFYKNKSQQQSTKLIIKFLKALNKKFDDLAVTKIQTTYKTLIKRRYKSFDSKAEIDDLNYFADVNPNVSFNNSKSFNQYHFIN